MERVHIYAKNDSVSIRDEVAKKYFLDSGNDLILVVEHPIRNIGIKWKLGNEPEDLTINWRMKDVKCSVNYGWSANCEVNSEDCMWYITDDGLAKTKRVYIWFHNILVYEEGISLLECYYIDDDKKIIMDTMSVIPVYKRKPELKIDSFSYDWVEEQNMARVYWCVLGAESCKLYPKDIEVEPVGEKLIPISKMEKCSICVSDRTRSLNESIFIYPPQENHNASSESILTKEEKMKETILVFDVQKIDDLENVYKIEWVTNNVLKVDIEVSFISNDEPQKGYQTIEISHREKGKERWQIDAQSKKPIIFLIHCLTLSGKMKEASIILDKGAKIFNYYQEEV